MELVTGTPTRHAPGPIVRADDVIADVRPRVCTEVLRRQQSRTKPVTDEKPDSTQPQAGAAAAGMNRQPWYWLAVVSAIGFLLVGAMLTSLTVYTTTMQAEFHWDETRMGLGPVALLLGMSLGNLLTGRATSILGIRGTFLAGTMLAAMAWFGAGFVQALGQLLVAAFACGVGIGLGSIVPSLTLIAGVFDAKKGLAMGIFIGATALASSVMPYATGVLIRATSWRWAFWVVGVATFVIGLALLRTLPARIAAGPGHAAQAASGAPRRTAKWAYAALLLAITASQVSLNGVLFNVVAYLDKSGLGLPAAIRIYSIANFVSLPGLLIGGYVSDRVRPYVLLPVILLLEAIGTAALLGVTSPLAAWACLALFILVWGGVSGLPAQAGSMHLAEVAAPSSYALLLGTLFTVSGIVGAAAPAAVGWLYDTTHDYFWPMALLAALSVLAAVAALFSRPDAGESHRVVNDGVSA